MDFMMFNRDYQFDVFLTAAHVITVSEWVGMCIS